MRIEHATLISASRSLRLCVVLQELGFSYVEMNASCTRSKNSLKEVVAESLNNTSIENFYKGHSSFQLPFIQVIKNDTQSVHRLLLKQQR